jgi:MFS transporter, ACDE family, multidrug resistance protein
VLRLNIHAPFLIAAGIVVAGIGVLATAHRVLADADQPAARPAPAPPAGPAASRVIVDQERA